jgi:sortase (surface protein transpeptidase)
LKVVDAIGEEYVLLDQGDSRLTLTTCHPKFSAKERLVVTAELLKIESFN